jgi:hypothetical protein
MRPLNSVGMPQLLPGYLPAQNGRNPQLLQRSEEVNDQHHIIFMSNRHSRSIVVKVASLAPANDQIVCSSWSWIVTGTDRWPMTSLDAASNSMNKAV